jgi:hypothetical protein
MQHPEQQFVLLSDVESDRVRMPCSCAAGLVRVAAFGLPGRATTEPIIPEILLRLVLTPRYLIPYCYRGCGTITDATGTGPGEKTYDDGGSQCSLTLAFDDEGGVG